LLRFVIPVPATRYPLLRAQALRAQASRAQAPQEYRNMKNVIPAEAGIQTYLDKSLSYFWIPASAGTSLDSCLHRNDINAGFLFTQE